MKQVRVISAYCKGGGQDLYEGTLLTVGKDITEREAQLRIKQGYLEPVAEEPAGEEPAGEEPEHPEADDEIVDRDPKPGRGKRK